MPKGPPRHKKFGSRLSQRRDKIGTKPFIVKDLLHKFRIAGKSLPDTAAASDSWDAFLRHTLPAPLGEQIQATHVQADTLTVFVATAGWGARLRFALEELKPAIAARSPAVTRVQVKVQRPS